MKYTTTIVQTGNNTGIEVSEQALVQLGGGKKPLVVVTLNGHTYRSAVGKMGDRFMIGLSAENRMLAKVKGGDTVEVAVELDTAPRTVEIPVDLQAAFDQNEAAKAAFAKLAPSKQKAIVTAIHEAKAEETRAKRVQKAIDQLSS